MVAIFLEKHSFGYIQRKETVSSSPLSRHIFLYLVNLA